MKNLFVGLFISLLALPAYADETAKTSVWSYQYNVSEFNEDSVSASMVSEPARSIYRTSQGILNISYDVTDTNKEDPDIMLILYKATTDSCMDTCVANLKIDGVKQPIMQMEELGHTAYKLKEPKSFVDKIKDAHSIKIGVLLYPDDIAIYEFSPKESLDLKKLPYIKN